MNDYSVWGRALPEASRGIDKECAARPFDSITLRKQRQSARAISVRIIIIVQPAQTRCRITLQDV
jgi:hypothetical protein